MNDCTPDASWPIPNIAVMLRRIGSRKSKIFGIMDLTQGYHQAPLSCLINVCLDNDRATGQKGLGIVRYSVMPLSNNSGVIGWVENCDTLNQLVKQYRESKDMRLGIEVKLLQTKSINHDKLPLLNKVEIFKQVLEETTGVVYPQ